MLVLSRKPGEKVVIAGNIVVTVLGIYHGVVRVGIEAPREVEIHRDAVKPRDHQEGQR